MARLVPLVVSPAVPLLEFETFDLLLVSVEAWPDRVRIRLAVSANAEVAVDALDVTLAEMVGSWDRGGDSDWLASEHPFTQFFQRIDFSLHDSAATPYWRSNASVGGSGSDWEASWLFRPGLGTEVHDLVVLARTPSGEGRVAVHLGDRP